MQAGGERGVRMLVVVTSTCCTLLSKERREAVRQTWVRRTLQNHANVDVRFVLAQPDVNGHPGGLGSPSGAADAAIEAAFRMLEVGTCLQLPHTAGLFAGSSVPISTHSRLL